MSLKNKTIKGVSWAMTDKLFRQAFQFGIGIVLARLLSPKEFGLTGMLAVFIGLSQAFVISGFSEALIRKTDAEERDFSTVFWYNVVVSIVCYGLLILCSGYISRFFGEPLLDDLLVIFGLSIIFNAFGVVSRARLIKRLDFKSLAKASVISTFLAGGTAVIMALNDFGVWSLVWKLVIESLVISLLFNYFAKSWISFSFSIPAFKELFSFGSNLLVADITNKFFDNVYKIVIGKFFSAFSLGLYVKADNYKNLPSQTISKTIQVVSYPALAELRTDVKRLKRAYKRLIQSTMYLTFVLMFILVAAAEHFIVGLIGPQWKDAVPFLQLLCFVGMFYPLNSLNLNMLKVMGRSDIFLRLTLIVRLLSIPVIIIGIIFGIQWLIVSMIFTSGISYYLNSYRSGEMIGYSFREQVTDIFPSMIVGAIVGLVAYLAGQLTDFPHLVTLFLQGVAGILAAVLLSEVFSIRPYQELKEIIIERLCAFRPIGRLFSH